MDGKKGSGRQWLIGIIGVILIIVGMLYNMKNYNSQGIRYLYNNEKVVASQGEWVEVEVIIENNGKTDLSSADSYFLSYHVLDSEGNVVLFDGARTPIDVPVRAKRRVKMQIAAPWEAGEYFLQLDIVQESVEWLETNESQKEKIVLEVRRN